MTGKDPLGTAEDDAFAMFADDVAEDFESAEIDDYGVDEDLPDEFYDDLF